MAVKGRDIKYPEQLQQLLEDILESRNVYFQPPSDMRMSYPCIVYELDYVNTFYGNNKPYLSRNRYTVTYIDKLPDMTVPNKIGKLPLSSFSRFYTTEDFNHYVYKLYSDEVV